MEVHVAPEIERRLCDLASQSGCETGKLLEDALAGYFDEVMKTRTLLDSRYDDLKSGKVDSMSIDQVETHFSNRSGSVSNSYRG